MTMNAVLILGLALLFDFALGDPPDAAHPVSWMGRVISSLERRRPGGGPRLQFAYGVMMTVVTVALFAVPSYYLLAYLKDANLVAQVIIGAAILKLTFSYRGLRNTALKIKELLRKESLNEARFELRSLVSRDTGSLPRPLLVSAAVESVAEGACDSFVAPLFYFILFGVPGAVAYRVVNTLDSMIGYHGKYEYLGKFASRLDDGLNFIPARLTTLLLVLAAACYRRGGRRSWRVARSDHAKTESPNAGWPMAATAGALNVQLEKVGHYKLGRAGASLTTETIDGSLGLLQGATLGWIVVCFATEVIRFVY